MLLWWNTVLELARSGADIKGVVSFHGGLSTVSPKYARKIKGSVLILHGAVDPNVSPEESNGFIKEMEDVKADMRSWNATLQFFKELTQ
jgi:dienelactone hydrolase